MGTVVGDILFRFVRLLVIFCDTLIGSVTGRQRPKQHQIEVLRILARRKTDFSDEYDYVFTHESFEKSATLMDEHWIPAKLSKKFAYFALMPKPMRCYQVDTAPFLWISVFDDCLKLARISIDDFVTLADTKVGPPKGNVTFVHNPPRSGSTLLCNMLCNLSPKVLVFSEAEIFGQTVYQCSDGSMHWDNDFTHNAVVPAVIKWLSKNMTREETYIIKGHPHDVKNIGHVQKHLPKIRHVFLFRRNIQANLESLTRLLYFCEASLDRRLMHQLFWVTPLFFDCLQMPTWYRSELDLVKKIRPKDLMELAGIVILSVFKQYKTSRNTDHFLIFYEDLLANPLDYTESLLKYSLVGSEVASAISLAPMQHDSQAGTWLSSKGLKKVPIPEIGREAMDRFKDICKATGVDDIEHILAMNSTTIDKF